MLPFTLHIRMDNVHTGVNRKIAETLGLKDLNYSFSQTANSTQTGNFCTPASAEKSELLCSKQAPESIGDYDSCSFNVEGQGTFRGNENSNPFVGEVGKLHQEAETRMEVIYEKWKEKSMLQALFASHPYER